MRNTFHILMHNLHSKKENPDKSYVIHAQEANSHTPESLPCACTQVSSGDLTKEGATVDASRIFVPCGWLTVLSSLLVLTESTLCDLMSQVN